MPNTIVPTAWTACTSGLCSFDGLRQVRYGAGNRWVAKTFMSEFWAYMCSAQTFGSDPAPGASKTCEIANVRQSGTLAPPASACHLAAGGCPTIDLTNIPLGLPGHGEPRIRNEGATVTQTQDGGSFRTVCGYSHMAFDDPIVFPGRPGASHLHTFFGNTGADAFSTADTIANAGNSTCPGGTANRTAYWVPSLIDTRSGAPIVPSFTIWYYKTFKIPAAPLSATQPLPAGLRMIAGDPRAADRQPHAGWGCFGLSGGQLAIENCKVGDSVEMGVSFPSCWDGRNLDSPDHRSHMAYSRGAEGCPATHPVAVPEIKLNVRYLVQAADAPRYWRLSSDNLALPPGHSAHADWFNGWDPAVMRTWVTNCSQRTVDCGVDNLGNGSKLY